MARDRRMSCDAHVTTQQQKNRQGGVAEKNEINMDELLTVLSRFLLLIFVCPTLGAWQDGDDGVDRPLGDLLFRPIVLDTNAGPKDCAALCTSYKFGGCKGWVFFKRDCGGEMKPSCRLKAVLNKQKSNSCAVSHVTCLSRF